MDPLVKENVAIQDSERTVTVGMREFLSHSTTYDVIILIKSYDFVCRPIDPWKTGFSAFE